MKDEILNFWDQRSKLGKLAGTNDFILTEIEQKFILNEIKENSHVLDIGCGNSSTLIKLCKEKSCSGVGIDFSRGMVNESINQIKKHKLNDKIKIFEHKLPDDLEYLGSFDFILCNRSLINLKSKEDQRESILKIKNILNVNGIFLMIECSNQGQENTNILRRSLGLDEIKAPWHNLFFNEKDVESYQDKNFKIIEFKHITSTYHFVSRVLYAEFCKKNNLEMNYDSDLNLISKSLPQEIGEFGPVKSWKWMKC